MKKRITKINISKKIVNYISIFTFLFFTTGSINSVSYAQSFPKYGTWSVGKAYNSQNGVIRQTQDGGYVVGGSSIIYENGRDYFGLHIGKLNSDFSLAWANMVGVQRDLDSFKDLVPTSDNGFIAIGALMGTADIVNYLVKVNSTGNIEWSKSFENGKGSLKSVRQTKDKGYIVCGVLSATTTNNIYVAKLKENGDLEWANTIEQTTNTSGNSIVQTSDDGYIITGSGPAGGVYAVKLKTDGSLDWAKEIGAANGSTGNAIEQTSDGGYVIAGTITNLGAGSGDVYVVKLSATGNIDWTEALGGTKSDIAQAIQQTSDEGYIITGSTESFGAGGKDVYVIKLTKAGGLEWANAIGGAKDDDGGSVEQTPGGAYIIGGTTQSFSGGGSSEVYLIKVDVNGNTCNMLTTDTKSTIGGAITVVSPTITSKTTISASNNQEHAGWSIETICQSLELQVVGTQSVLCSGGATGSATVTATGGEGSYTFNWIPTGGNGSVEKNMKAGNYTVTVMDSKSVTATVTLAITQPTQRKVTSSTGTIACNGGVTTATISVTGGTPDYSYKWKPSGGTDATASGLHAAGYTVVITDANGCTNRKEIIIAEPQPVLVTATSGTIACYGGKTDMEASVTGGTQNYSYQWFPDGGDSPIVQNVAAGTYTVAVTDAHNCTGSQTIAITQPTTMQVTATSGTVACNGGATDAVVSVGGGTPGYSYNWLPSGGSSAIAAHLTTGTYTVNILDHNNCPASATVNIIQPEAINATISSGTITCHGGYTTASVIVTGGVKEYSYLWIPIGVTSPSWVDVPAGSYTVIVTDKNGCTKAVTKTITQPDAMNKVIVLSSDTLTALQTGAEYQWINCDSSNKPILGATKQSYIVTTSGSYAVRLKVGDCTDFTPCFSVILTGINTVNGFSDLITYPNPATDIFQIKSSEAISRIELFSLTGSKVYTSLPNSKEINVNVQDLPAGLYFLRATTSKGVVNSKVIVK